MSETKIYIELDDDIKQSLDENGLNIGDILQIEGIDAHVFTGAAPYQIIEKVRKKELITVILAGTAAVVSIAFAISKFLNTIYNRPIIVKFFEIEEVRGARGDVLLDKEGNPIIKKIEKFEILQPKMKEMQQIKASFDFKNGVVIEFSSETDSNDNAESKSIR